MAESETTVPAAPPPECPAPEPSNTSEEKTLPKLSASEFRTYNHMAEHMDYYHNHFRATWNTMMSACDAGKRPKNLSIRQFLQLGLQFCHQLTMHHTIEEQHVFPVLGRKMPAFKNRDELLAQHQKIHEGLEKLEEYLEACRGGERELRLGELKGVLDGFGKVLWQHLDDEVKQLGAENMRKYWTPEEMRRMPM
ncbi:hypothetical protein BDV96DRAFT_609499 [Lophiotrema nucula]|uniref:Hemerythrin-like domain-containing protein n=1 Tax=Lophiotrema nucula TaxID=690887 RepID=A0A6A5ZT04_9PLEO|nr:hypothetical protein BDV96DRAFT_609499 [Lophiotrema nucula]